MRSMRLLMILWFGLATCLIFSDFSFAELPYGTPKANMDITGLVPFDTVQKIASKSAQKMWGQAVLGDSIPCVDADGYIVAYIFPVAIGAKSFPSNSEMQSSVHYGRKIANEGFDACDEKDKALLRERIINKKKELNTASGKRITAPAEFTEPQATEQDNVSLNTEARKLGLKKMIGADQFGTVVVAARYDRFPVPLYAEGLPPLYYQGDLADILAREKLSAETVTLDKVYFLDYIRLEYFEFSSSDKRTVIMNAGSLNIERQEAVLKFRGKMRHPSPTAQSNIAAAWAKQMK